MTDSEAPRKSTYEVARDLAVAGFGDELKGGRHLGRWSVLGEGHPHAPFRLAADAWLAAEREAVIGVGRGVLWLPRSLARRLTRARIRTYDDGVRVALAAHKIVKCRAGLVVERAA